MTTIEELVGRRMLDWEEKCGVKIMKIRSKIRAREKERAKYKNIGVKAGLSRGKNYIECSLFFLFLGIRLDVFL